MYFASDCWSLVGPSLFWSRVRVGLLLRQCRICPVVRCHDDNAIGVAHDPELSGTQKFAAAGIASTLFAIDGVAFVLLCLMVIWSTGCSKESADQPGSPSNAGAVAAGATAEGAVSVLGIPFAVTVEELRRVLPAGTRVVSTIVPNDGSLVASIIPVPGAGAKAATTSTSGLSRVTAVFSAEVLSEESLWRLMRTSSLGWTCGEGDLQAFLDAEMSVFDGRFDQQFMKIVGAEAGAMFASARRNLAVTATCKRNEIVLDFIYLDIDRMKFKNQAEALRKMADFLEIVKNEVRK